LCKEVGNIDVQCLTEAEQLSRGNPAFGLLESFNGAGGLADHDVKHARIELQIASALTEPGRHPQVDGIEWPAWTHGQHRSRGYAALSNHDYYGFKMNFC
jgi:hypothetical protein